MWQRDPSYMALIRDAWGLQSEVLPLGGVQGKLKEVQSKLQDWDCNVFGLARKP
jgi:hypothetical protein